MLGHLAFWAYGAVRVILVTNSAPLAQAFILVTAGRGAGLRGALSVPKECDALCRTTYTGLGAPCSLV